MGEEPMRHALPSERITPAGLARVVLYSRTRIVSGSPTPIGALFRRSRSFEEGGCKFQARDVKLVADDHGRRDKDQQSGSGNRGQSSVRGDEFLQQLQRPILVRQNATSC